MNQMAFHTRSAKHSWTTLVRGTALIVIVSLPSFVEGSESPPLDFQEAPPVVVAVLDEFNVNYAVVGQRAGKIYGIRGRERDMWDSDWHCGASVEILDEKSLTIQTVATEHACSIATDDRLGRTYIEDGENGILVLDSATDALITTLESSGWFHDAVGINPLNGTIYHTSFAGVGSKFNLIDPNTFEIFASDRLWNNEIGRHIVTDGAEDGFVFSGGWESRHITVRDANTGEMISDVDNRAIVPLRYNAKHDEFWTCGGGPFVRVHDVYTGESRHAMRIEGHDGNNTTIQMDERHDRAYVCESSNLRVYDADTAELLQLIELEQGGGRWPRLAFNANAGRLYAVAKSQNKVSLVVFDTWGSGGIRLVARIELSSGGSVVTNPRTGRVYVYGGGSTFSPRSTTVLFDSLAWRRTRLVLLDELSVDVSSLGLQHGIESGLLAKLNTASLILGDLQDDNDHTAANLLDAFIHQIEAQSGKKIPTEDTDTLIEAAGEIITLIGGDG